MSKKKAALVLSVLLCAVVLVGLATEPALHYFMKVGTSQSMYATGASVGKALGSAFGSSLFEFIGVVLFLA
ncbi:MAG: hypothetical protein QF752_07795 [Planctomycetota bacterium]|jgi:uncharacterized membrane protein|nr:hypothetical protein [Planctomycetota bacterium]